jgi:hypothetical protein
VCIAFGWRSYTPCAELIGWRAKSPGLKDPGDGTKEIVAEKILELAEAGEADPERLCSAALRNLSDQ